VGLGVPVAGAGAEDVLDQHAGGVTAEPEVEEAGPGDDDVRDAGGLGEPGAQYLGDVEGRLPRGAGELEGDVGGVVPASPGTGRGDDGPLRNAHGQLSAVDGTTHGVQDGAGELDGGHGTSVGEEGGG
jgi:hypothetical protein